MQIAYNTAYILLFIKYNTIHRMYGIFGPSEVHALHGTRCPLYMAFFSSKATLKTTQWVFSFFQHFSQNMCQLAFCFLYAEFL